VLLKKEAEVTLQSMATEEETCSFSKASGPEPEHDTLCKQCGLNYVGRKVKYRSVGEAHLEGYFTAHIKAIENNKYVLLTDVRQTIACGREYKFPDEWIDFDFVAGTWADSPEWGHSGGFEFLSETTEQADIEEETLVRFLPMNDGTQLLIHEGGNTYRVVSPFGIAYRFSKDMDDRDRSRRGPEEHIKVDGDDEGDGWLKVVLQAPFSGHQRRLQRVWTDSDFGDVECEMETASDDADEGDAHSSELCCDTSGLAVKNTFIDGCSCCSIDTDMPRSLRRLNSLPPSFLFEEADSVSTCSGSNACTDALLDASTEMSDSEDSTFIPSSSGRLSDFDAEVAVPNENDSIVVVETVEADSDCVDLSESLVVATAIQSEETELVETPPPPIPLFPRPSPAARSEAPITASPSVSPKLNTRSREDFMAVLDHLQHQLMTREDCVLDVIVEETMKGWTVKTYVTKHTIKAQQESLKQLAQQAILDATKQSELVYILGYDVHPFTSSPRGLGCALVKVPDPEHACWDSYSRSFCCSPGFCKLQHPTGQAGVNMMFLPARER